MGTVKNDQHKKDALARLERMAKELGKDPCDIRPDEAKKFIAEELEEENRSELQARFPHYFRSEREGQKSERRVRSALRNLFKSLGGELSDADRAAGPAEPDKGPG